MISIYIPNFSLVFYITIFVLYNSDLYSIFSYLYSIVNVEQNLPNDMCALLGLMRVLAAEWAYRGRRGEGLEGTIICGVCMVGQTGWFEVWEWVWLGGGRCVWGG